MRLHDYLQRLGIEGAPPASVDTLRRLHVAHREAFLFENLSIHQGETIRLSIDALERKFLDNRRGGYCFEHNTLFAAVLRDLGFRPVTLLGRVRRGPPERWARTHMVLRVPIDDEVWLADVGFGGAGLLEPIALRDGATATQAGLSYALRRDGHLWILAMHDAVQAMDLYEFGEDPQTAGDVEVANHYTSTHPDSIFRQAITIQQTTRTGRIILRGDLLVRYNGDSAPVEEAVTPERARALARELFGIEIAKT